MNRLSLGVQALNDPDLKGLGRGHSVAEALAALGLGKRIFAARLIRSDLCPAGPDASATGRTSCSRALALADDHLSLYQLTLERGTPFYAMAKRGSLKVPSDDELRRHVRGHPGDHRRGRPSGLRGLEPRPARRRKPPQPDLLALRRICRHRPRRPWPAQCARRPGLNGSEVGPTAFRQKRSPETWLKFVERRGDGTDESQTLDPDECGAEMLMMGMRLAEGVDAARFREVTGKKIEDFIGRARSSS